MKGHAEPEPACATYCNSPPGVTRAVAERTTPSTAESKDTTRGMVTVGQMAAGSPVMTLFAPCAHPAAMYIRPRQ